MNKTLNFIIECEVHEYSSEIKLNKNICCFSGGVDSFCTLFTRNDSIDTLFYAINYDVYSNQKQLLKEQLETINKIAKIYKKKTILCSSNLKILLNPKFNYLSNLTIKHDKWIILHAPCKVCNLYNLSYTYDNMYISSWYRFDVFETLSDTRILLDSNKTSDELFSSKNVIIKHVGNYTRLEKIHKCISIDSDTFFKYLKVCWENPNEEYNCSKFL